MTRLLLLISAFLSVSAKTLWHQLDTVTFEQYLSEYNLQYSESELPARRERFNSEVARIKAHNAKDKSWKEGLSKFTLMTEAEKKAFFGRSKGASSAGKKTLKNLRDLPSDFKLREVSELPKNVDWRSKGIVSPVKDQGHCGSCWAFASTAVIESHVAKETGLMFDLSVQQMAMCAPNPNHCGGSGGCAGSTAELAYDYVTKSSGLYQEYQYSYLSYYGKDYDCAIPSGNPVATINGYVQLPLNNYTALMNAIATVGPIAVSVDASAWSSYESGIFDGCNQKNPDIDHAVVLVGYGEENGSKFWTIRNSWSPGWGEKGYIRIARTDDEQNRCGSDITPQDGTACEGENDPVEVCGTCGIIYDSAYPLNAALA
jgi:cathepsin L